LCCWSFFGCKMGMQKTFFLILHRFEIFELSIC
jgi:hypothetical protein